MSEEEIRKGYTRVTEILKPYSTIGEAIDKNPGAVERMKNIGTEVHNAIHLFNQYIPPSLSHEAQPYFDSYLFWVQETKAKTIISETRYYDDILKITGCVDSVVKLPHEDWNVMIDWKTCAAYTPRMKLTWMYQGTFYHYLMVVNGVENVGDRFLFVQLDKHGELPKVREFSYSSRLMGECEAQVKAYRCYHPL